MFFIGIDGGGTKTEFALADETGNVISRFETKGISYRQYSSDEILSRLREGITTCLGMVDLKLEDVSRLCIGYPCYGESIKSDAEIKSLILNAFPSTKFLILNDVEIGWAGALNCQPGIHVVSGTGSIAFGKDKDGRALRCGGWLDFFSDEGSSYWLGRKAMQLFSMQSDGRLPKGSLYFLFRKKFDLKFDFQFIDIMHHHYIPHRERIASLQLDLLAAAKQGDKSAIDLYFQATSELVNLVGSLKNQLNFDDGLNVSYSGSLFKEEQLVLQPFTDKIRKIGGFVVRPFASPVVGAIKLAIDSTENQ
jgi:N-acetylglucosamine kinase-like BadF-type ATPase